MSSKKKSFLLHIDSLDILDDLTNGQAGVLFKAIKAYQHEDDFPLDGIVKIAFSPFKNQFSRDNVKYENLCEKNRLIAINRYKDKPTTGNSGNETIPSVTKSTDNKNKNKTNNDSDNEVKEIIDFLNITLHSKYKHTTKSHSENISARLNDGHSVDDLKLVIKSKANEWLNDKVMAQYLRPSTLFQASKFQGYLLHAKPMSCTNKPTEFSQ